MPPARKTRASTGLSTGSESPFSARPRPEKGDTRRVRTSHEAPAAASAATAKMTAFLMFSGFPKIPPRRAPRPAGPIAARLRGVESQGMILAGDSAATIALLTPERELPTGSRVR